MWKAEREENPLQSAWPQNVNSFQAAGNADHKRDEIHWINGENRFKKDAELKQ